MFLCLFLVVFFFRGNLTELDPGMDEFFLNDNGEFYVTEKVRASFDRWASFNYSWMDGWMILISMDTMDESNITQWWCNCGCILVLDQIFWMALEFKVWILFWGQNVFFRNGFIVVRKLWDGDEVKADDDDITASSREDSLTRYFLTSTKMMKMAEKRKFCSF